MTLRTPRKCLIVIEELERRAPHVGGVQDTEMRGSQDRVELSLSNEVRVRSAGQKRAVGEIVRRAGAVLGGHRGEESILCRQIDEITALRGRPENVAEHEISGRARRFTSRVERGEKLSIFLAVFVADRAGRNKAAIGR